MGWNWHACNKHRRNNCYKILAGQHDGKNNGLEDLEEIIG
jgi:hypothetical protein